jgi:hypothetical protein
MSAYTPPAGNAVVLDLRNDYSSPAGNDVILEFEEFIELIATSMNIADAWRLLADMKINVGDSWKIVTEVKINIGDVWKNLSPT